MQNIDVMLEPLRGFLQQIGAFLPRLAIAIGILLVGWLHRQGVPAFASSRRCARSTSTC